MKRVLFVCTGNTCRSPMAQALFNHYTKDITDLSATSCGLYGDGISPISDNARAALAEKGIDFSHTSSPISEDCVKNADYIIGMTASHAKSIISMFPDCADKIYAMPREISDPFGGSIEEYRSCRNEIEECVVMLIKAILGDK